MATHGAILLQEKVLDSTDINEILLHTCSDGHVGDALEMLISIPLFVAEKSWEWKVIARHIQPQDRNREYVEDALESHNTQPFCLLELAHYISHWRFNRWHVIPKEFQVWLPEYFHNPDNYDIYVEINHDDTYVILRKQLERFMKENEVEFDDILNFNYGWPKKGEEPKEIGQLIEELNQKLTTKIEVTDEGIVVPAKQMFIDKVCELVINGSDQEKNN